MRTTLVEGKEYPCPRYVVRVNAGWQLRLPGQTTLFFGDTRFGSTEAAHRAAVAMRAEKLPLTAESEHRFARTERSTKRHPLGIPGVFLVRQPKRGPRVPSFYLHVINKNQPARTLYVGTEKTWESRLPAKLAQAAEIRAEQIRRASEGLPPSKTPPSAASGATPEVNATATPAVTTV